MLDLFVIVMCIGTLIGGNDYQQIGVGVLGIVYTIRKTIFFITKEMI